MSAIAAVDLPGVLGHELRNPLASAMTGAMLARELLDTEDPRAPVLDGVLRDLDRMTALIDGWLRLARTNRSANRPLDVDRLIRDAAARCGAEIVAETTGAAVRGDTELLARVFDNLADNARHAGASNLRLAAQVLGDEVSIHLEDDGSGVPREKVERIFAPGYSGRGSNGLGLHVVATTVAAHGGRVRCTPLTRGTRFTITLPLAGEPTASA